MRSDRLLRAICRKRSEDSAYDRSFSYRPRLRFGTLPAASGAAMVCHMARRDRGAASDAARCIGRTDRVGRAVTADDRLDLQLKFVLGAMLLLALAFIVSVMQRAPQHTLFTASDTTRGITCWYVPKHAGLWCAFDAEPEVTVLP